MRRCNIGTVSNTAPIPFSECLRHLGGVNLDYRDRDGPSDLDYWRRRLMLLIELRGSYVDAEVLRVSRILDQSILDAQLHMVDVTAGASWTGAQRKDSVRQK